MDVIPDDLKHELLNYFNGDLRANLGFRERYFFDRFENGTIFFNALGESVDLYNILASNHEITVRLKQELITFLSSYFSDLDNVRLSFNNSTFGIILERNPSQIINVNPYVNIASNFDTVEELDNFCQSSKGTLDVCKTKEFWKSLLESVYPGPYKGEYKYEPAYKGYLQVKPYLDRDVLAPTPTMKSEYIGEYLRFLYGEELIPLKDYKKFVILAVNFGLTPIFQKIYTNISAEDRKLMIDYLEGGVQMSMATKNVVYITNFFRMVPVTLINNVNLMGEIKMVSKYDLNLDLDVDLVDPIVQYFMSGDRATPYGVIIGHIILRNAIKNNNMTLLDYAFKHFQYTRFSVVAALQTLQNHPGESTPEVKEYLRKARYL